jgi:hypothetical protein
MLKKRKKTIIILVLLGVSAVVAAIGLKYFPFTKVIKLPAASEQEYADPVKIRALPPNAIQLDFEVAAGKEVPDGFYKGLAHSGQYSVKAFGQNSFSNGFQRTAEQVGLANLKTVALSAWVYVFPTKNDVQGSLVFTVSNDLGVNVLWHGVGVREPEVPRGKWFKVSGKFDLSSLTFKPQYRIQVYFWNNSRTDILVDDFYAVFGDAPERRGDSARVDLTKPEGYVPKFNFPPFRVNYLERDSITGTVKPADLRPADLVAAGDFFSTGNDGIIALKPDGKIPAFVFCPESDMFRKVTVVNPGALSVAGKIRILHALRMAGGNAALLVAAGEKGWIAAELKKPDKPCKEGVQPQTTLTVVHQSAVQPANLVCGNFTGDARQEILVVSTDGSWDLLLPEPAPGRPLQFKSLRAETKEPLQMWNQKDHRVGLTAGRFLPGLPHDVVLTVAQEGNGGGCFYALFSWQASSNAWMPVYPEKQQHRGLTIGLDTLKPDDRYFVMNTGKGTRVFRYNRDWRFDLKEIRFSDSAFTILTSVDFRGYGMNRNPKYYEQLLLVPGMFRNPAGMQFLVTGSVAHERKYEAVLPEFVDMYSLINESDFTK